MTGPVIACVLSTERYTSSVVRHDSWPPALIVIGVLIVLPMALFAWGLCMAAGRTERLDEKMRRDA